jgi:hypothetical protein
MPKKIRRLWPGLNPQSWVPKASMLTTTPVAIPTELLGPHLTCVEHLFACHQEALYIQQLVYFVRSTRMSAGC